MEELRFWRENMLGLPSNARTALVMKFRFLKIERISRPAAFARL